MLPAVAGSTPCPPVSAIGQTKSNRVMCTTVRRMYGITPQQEEWSYIHTYTRCDYSMTKGFGLRVLLIREWRRGFRFSIHKDVTVIGACWYTDTDTPINSQRRIAIQGMHVNESSTISIMGHPLHNNSCVCNNYRNSQNQDMLKLLTATVYDRVQHIPGDNIFGLRLVSPGVGMQWGCGIHRTPGDKVDGPLGIQIFTTPGWYTAGRV